MGLEMPETQAHRHFPACRYRGTLGVCVYVCVCLPAHPIGAQSHPSSLREDGGDRRDGR